jgi:hypothetical protein
MKMQVLGYGWAQPVTSRRWAFLASALFYLSRLTGHRVLNHQKHVAWQKACGL